VGVTAQALRLCTAALALSLGLGLIRGWPAAPKPTADAGSCHGPSSFGLTGDGADPDRVRWIAQPDARGLVGKLGVAFVDCRPRQQFEAGHVAGALHLEPREADVSSALKSALAGASTIVTYCDADNQCARSLSVARQLTKAGLGDVRVLEGGLPAWLEHGFPAESGTCQQCAATR
jgi:rhodanese-related sulfurtransferase